MYRHTASHLQFISQFVDSVTVRPFLQDLRRVHQAAMLFRQLPRVERYEHTNTEAA